MPTPCIGLNAFKKLRPRMRDEVGLGFGASRLEAYNKNLPLSLHIYPPAPSPPLPSPATTTTAQLSEAQLRPVCIFLEYLDTARIEGISTTEQNNVNPFMYSFEK